MSPQVATKVATTQQIATQRRSRFDRGRSHQPPQARSQRHRHRRCFRRDDDCLADHRLGAVHRDDHVGAVVLVGGPLSEATWSRSARSSIERNEVISDAATGWGTQGIGFGYSAGVTGRQFCNDFNGSWNVFQAVTGYKGAKSSNRLPCPLPQFVEQKPCRRRSQPEHRLGRTAAEMAQRSRRSSVLYYQ
jgi:hypothetical protein